MVLIEVRETPTGGTPDYPIRVGGAHVTTGINQYDAKLKVRIIRRALKAAGHDDVRVSWPESKFVNWEG